MRPIQLNFSIITFLLATVSCAQKEPHSESLPSAVSPVHILREEAQVAYGGAHETWRLEWTAKPKEACAIKSEDSQTCPCSEFSYAEYGPADLARIRDGREIQRFHLAPLFNGADLAQDETDAVFQHWPAEEADFSATPPAPETIRNRPPVKIMNIADYNHDGWSSEFVLQVGAGPCGHRSAVLLGVTKAGKNHVLHAFGTVKSPHTPLVLAPAAWRLLRESKRIRYVSLQCGDHAADEQEEITLQIVANGIRAFQETFACRDDLKKGKFIRRVEL